MPNRLWIAGLAAAYTLVTVGASASAQPGGAPPSGAAAEKPEDLGPVDYAAAEAGVLTGHVQLTRRDQFIKAGEAYFSPDGSSIIFQAIPVPPAGEAPESFYQMYVAKVKRDSAGKIKGLGEPQRLSPPGSSNTCGWFHPTLPTVVMFGSTLVAPSLKDVPGYQRNTGRYVWQFHSEMQIVMAQVFPEEPGEGGLSLSATTAPKVLFNRDGYAAEGSWSADGRSILYASFDRARSERLGRNHLDIMVFDGPSGTHTPLITADGYNGGPFFSPDGKAICFRSDRKGDSLLQIYVAELKTGEGGAITGVEREFPLTANQHVNWAPFWHPSGRFLVYASSEVGHRNYEIFAIPVDFEKLRAGQQPSDIPHARVTTARGADVLPAFSPDGQWMMWTAQRGDPAPGEERPSSQLWAAEFNQSAFRFNGK